MIRILYEWSVDPANIAAFRTAWQQTTRQIHADVKGARGSFMLQDANSPGRILTVARWDSIEDWQAFWKQDDPEEMQVMRSLGERVSVTVYDEFADFTV